MNNFCSFLPQVFTLFANLITPRVILGDRPFEVSSLILLLSVSKKRGLMKKRRGTLSMLKLKEIIRLKDSSLSQQQIARSLSISVGVVHKYLKLAKGANVTWSIAKEMSEKELKARLLPMRHYCSSFVPPDYDLVYKEMKHKSVTLQLLHEEYCQANPGQHYR